MTLLVAITLVACAGLIGLYLLYRSALEMCCDLAVRLKDCQIALDFIREEHADLPHEFAAIVLAGNHLAMQRKFPGFAEFRAACLNEARRDRDDQEADL